ncbi:NUDIX domain-containing protein [Novosphingobium sp. TH158]|uniref:NUDIX domain-containing protein n=1 Tax=Novosphingobium sp. TH158 TaxID=2067455 RepID=UPI000C79571A|nr:NUDIX domain-containing protein [Novosphingobium sp. TH158]PLK26349.1 NUDIX hydrolase [Novosphingobium sp. TH158]
MTSGPAFPTAIPAATVIVFRHGANGAPAELLMLERSGEMRFAGGAAVFPGGRVDEADRELAATLDHGLDLHDAAARVAGIRETLEESGLALGIKGRIGASEAADARRMLHDVGSLAPVLERFGWQPDLAALHPWARWCPNWERAFDTRFYLADLGTGAVEVAADDTEHTHLFWASAAEALAMAARGEISVIFPTRRNLERLALCDTFDAARSYAARFPIRTISPARREIEGQMHLTIPDDLGYPVTSEAMTTVQRG